MPKLILHIGTHKTGTTAIQTFLEANVAALEQRGIDFPIFDVEWPEPVLPNRNGYFLNRAALHRVRMDEPLPDKQLAVDCATKLARRVQGGKVRTVLLSDERMWYSGALQAAYWKAVKGVVEHMGFDGVEVIVYLRRQDLFAESLWNQFVKATKSTQTLEEYLATPRIKALCDYYAGVKRLEEVFGKRNIKVAVYERSRMKNGDAVDDFCQHIGLPLGAGYERPPENHTNPRLNNNLVELKRMVNKAPEFQQLQNVFGPSFAHAMLADDWTPRTELLPAEAREAFLAKFKKGNKLLAKEYFAGKQLFKPFKEGEAPQWEFEPQGMLRDAVVVMADMLSRQEKLIRNLEARVSQLERDRK